MKLLRRLGAAMALLSLQGILFAQTGESSSSADSQLKVSKRTETQAKGLPLGRVSCDTQGNFYLRQFDPDGSTANQEMIQGPVQKVNADGTLGPSFKITDVSPALSLRAFVVGAQGEVYVLAEGPPVNSTPSTTKTTKSTTDKKPNLAKKGIKFPVYYVVKFSSDGSVQSTTEIHRQIREFVPYHLGVFGNGGILISGTAGDYQRRPFTAVFDATGNLIKKIYEAEDEDSRQKAEAGDPLYVDDSANVGNNAVTDGEAATGPDGNVYLLRSTAPALIYVVSPDGEVVRRLHVDMKNPGFLPANMKASASGLAIVFRKKHSRETLIKVVDYDGNEKEVHSFDRNLPAEFFGCYVPPSFFFTKTDVNKTLHLVQVEPN